GQCCNPSNGNLTSIDDANVCTIDTCQPDGSVIHEDTTEAGLCCNPMDGTLTDIDDGELCTLDTCLPDGSVTHEPIEGCGKTGGFRIVPTRASGTVGVDWELGPGQFEITLHRADQLVEFEVEVRAPTSESLQVFQATISCDAFLSDPWDAMSIAGALCPDEGVFGMDFCRGVDVAREDYVFWSLIQIAAVATDSCIAPGDRAYAGGAVVVPPNSLESDGAWHYGFTGALEVEPQALGSFELAFMDDDNFTFMSRMDTTLFPIDELIPATIAITTGRCVVDGACTCSTFLDCEDIGGEFTEDLDGCGQDFDGDGEGDACDADRDGDGVANAMDVCDQTPMGSSVTVEGGPVCDVNFDCSVDLLDYAELFECISIGGPAIVPGSDPSCLSPFDLQGDGDVDLADVALFANDFAPEFLE
ncbi:MAG: thrombospondin type 3 repeat-containing protein, partial [Phycisphaerae bacterium]